MVASRYFTISVSQSQLLEDFHVRPRLAFSMSPLRTSPRSSITLTSQTTKDASILSSPPATPTTPTCQLSRATPPCPPTEASQNINGTLVDWDGPEDPHNPFNWPNPKKWRVTLLACFMTFVVQLNGTMLTSAAEQINESFHISDEHFPHSYWPVLSWNLGGAAAPLLGLPLMENFGVRISYLVCWRNIHLQET